MKHYNPTSPARRQMEAIDFKSVVTRSEPEKSLTRGRKRAVGRNAAGRITTRHKGGGVKRLWRAIDFHYRRDIPAVVESLEYDPNRTSLIALVRYADGERRYALAPSGWRVGAKFIASEKAPVEVGNRLPLRAIPVGTSVFNVELTVGKGAQLVRSAGVGAEVVAVEGNYVQLKLPSGEIRMVHASAWATIGSLSNPEHSLMTIGKAGRSRLMGIRPTVRGYAMNPRDHPYGGGEGRQPRGTRRPKTMWGKITGGVRTRKKRQSDQFILKRRT